MINFSALTRAFQVILRPECPFPGSAGGFYPLTHRDSPRQIKIGRSDQRKHICGILRDLLVANILVAELSLEEAEQMADASADRGKLVIETPFRLGQRMLLTGFARDSLELHHLPG